MDETVAAVKQAADIVDIIGGYVQLERCGNIFRGLCPFHEDTKPSLQVSPEHQNYRCWACGAKGDVFKFIEDSERITFREALERLAEKTGIALRQKSDGRASRVEAMVRVLAWSAKEFENCLWNSDVGAEARQYLEQRGLSESVAKEHGLGFAPERFDWLIGRMKSANVDVKLALSAGLIKEGQRGGHYDTFRGRLLFPIRDERGRVVSFGGRLLPGREEADRGPKYLNTAATEVYNKSQILYGLDYASKSLRGPKGTPRRLIVMEGYTDCLMAYQEGVSNAVATCGTALTAQHVARLKTYADQVVLMFDGDVAGQNAARKATSLFLAGELDLNICVLPDSLDPCDFLRQQGRQALEAEVDRSGNALDYQLAIARSRFDTTTLGGRRLAMEEVLPILAEVPTMTMGDRTVSFDLALSQLASSFGINEKELRSRLTEIRRRGGRFGQEPAKLHEESSERPIRVVGDDFQQIQWLATRPWRSLELKELISAENFEDPRVRRLVQAVYDLASDLEEEATHDRLRERMGDDPFMNDFLDLVSMNGIGDEQYEQGLENIKLRLTEKRRIESARAEGQRLGGNPVHEQVNDHLAVLGRLAGRVVENQGSN
ncbi:DNA primase [Planctomycetes bacterium Pan216]|uniref:DNA primase n=1 Tax=Kolteria novifilia TaxID=2527975 RepID=A0A518B8S7_9BACT|nr:DNA primase [Planctomycetes bacterium Pan216]